MSVLSLDSFKRINGDGHRHNEESDCYFVLKLDRRFSLEGKVVFERLKVAIETKAEWKRWEKENPREVCHLMLAS